MPDRGILFLFSLLMILGCLAASVWLVATGQAATVDGLFLLLTCLLIAATFLLYVVFLIKRAMAVAESASPAKTAAKSASPAKAAAEPREPAAAAR